MERPSVASSRSCSNRPMESRLDVWWAEPTRLAFPHRFPLLVVSRAHHRARRRRRRHRERDLGAGSRFVFCSVLFKNILPSSLSSVCSVYTSRAWCDTCVHFVTLSVCNKQPVSVASHHTSALQSAWICLFIQRGEIIEIISLVYCSGVFSLV